MKMQSSNAYTERCNYMKIQSTDVYTERRTHTKMQFCAAYTAEPVYSYIIYSRFFGIVELNLVPFAFISSLFYPYYSRLLL